MIGNKVAFTLLVLLLAVGLTACGAAVPEPATSEVADWANFPTPAWQEIPGQLPQSLKGYELYSWLTGSTRVYTLVTGTNREKSFEEITTFENTVDGEYLKMSVINPEDLKTLLSRLPPGEEVFWGGINLEGQVSEGTIYFSYPSEKEMTEILNYSQDIGINLHTVQDSQDGD